MMSHASLPGPLLVGLDVGSTTVKAVVVDGDTDAILWRCYERHETRQAEKVRDLLARIERDTGVATHRARIFATGSGGGAMADLIGARFVQEVTAVAFAVERLYPDVRSVIELGGQDAKIIVFREGPSGRLKKIPSMNDKCAGGTGAVVDKIAAKLRIPAEDVGTFGYDGVKLHRVAGKCGVFAETDINGLQKLGTPVDQLMASLFDAIVLQNLTVLTRGYTLLPRVLLLGGPNAFIRGLREAWRAHIPRMWQERGVTVPPGAPLDDLIEAPADALYFAAIGAVAFGKDDDGAAGTYRGLAGLERYIDVGRRSERLRTGGPGLVASAEALESFRREFSPPPFVPAVFRPGQTVRAFVGLDGGSTSTKAVLCSPDGDVLAKAYRLSDGNPIEDAKTIFEALSAQVEGHDARLEILGVATTGYAKDLLRDLLHADVALVETVAHTEAALRLCADPHVIVDVGGQDIKLIVLKDGRVKDFKLNTQCSAGNGYFLQSTAQGFGVPVAEYAQAALSADVMPTFGYGCAVFLQSDIVNFQRQGWHAEEILAGLAAVLPKNVFLYVARWGSLPALGSRFVLQGGTQNNLAVVKAEVDFIRASFRSSGREPEILVHEHCGEAGAIGAALEARRVWQEGRRTSFIGMDALRRIRYTTKRDEDTRCSFCRNACLRTFIDVSVGGDAPPATAADPPETRRLIVATCEKGAAGNLQDMRGIKAEIEAVMRANPNLVDVAAREAFRRHDVPSVADPPPRTWTPAARARAALMTRRASLRVGIPRVLNAYVYAPLFNAYLQSLGIAPEHIVYSDYTTDDLYRTGSSRGAIDPCFPSKIAIAHVHNLIEEKTRRRPLDVVFFPMIDALHTPLAHVQASDACPTVTACPSTVKAAFSKEGAILGQRGIRLVEPMLDFSKPRLLAYQLFEAWAPVLGLSEAENDRAVEAGYRALRDYESGLRRRAREVLDMLEREDRIGLVMLGRPYHHDPGVNHGILEAFQKRGYPVFSQSTLPDDADLLDRLFGAEVRAGLISDPLDISDVWKNSFSASTNHKLWAAKFTARHPNLVALELSSFKCGHDAPIYGAIEAIIEQSGTPYFSFKDLDENAPAGAIKIRVETIDYFLQRHRPVVADRRRITERIERELAGEIA